MASPPPSYAGMCSAIKTYGGLGGSGGVPVPVPSDPDCDPLSPPVPELLFPPGFSGFSGSSGLSSTSILTTVGGKFRLGCLTTGDDGKVLGSTIILGGGIGV